MGTKFDKKMANKKALKNLIFIYMHNLFKFESFLRKFLKKYNLEVMNCIISQIRLIINYPSSTEPYMISGHDFYHSVG